MNFFKVVATTSIKANPILCVALLVGCGSSDSSSNSTVLSDISGVWNSTIDGDETYDVFRVNGTYTEYDYLGDAFDNGANCYEKSDATIIEKGGNRFELISGGESLSFSANVKDDNITIKADGETLVFPRSDLQESDFTPLCDGSM